MAAQLPDEAAHNRFLDLLNTDGFAPWFSIVTPLTEIGLLPIGSRPAKRGLGAKSLDDLRTIPWIFSAQAHQPGRLVRSPAPHARSSAIWRPCVRLARRKPAILHRIDNIEMSIAKTDEYRARMHFSASRRPRPHEKVLNEMELTRKWVLAIVGDKWPLQHRHVLGQAIRASAPHTWTRCPSPVCCARRRCAKLWMC